MIRGILFGVLRQGFWNATAQKRQYLLWTRELAKNWPKIKLSRLCILYLVEGSWSLRNKILGHKHCLKLRALEYNISSYSSQNHGWNPYKPRLWNLKWVKISIKLKIPARVGILYLVKTCLIIYNIMVEAWLLLFWELKIEI